jgi:DNA (cytosine-5)-methyltransferase 1
MQHQKTVTEDFGTTHCSVAAPLTFGSLFAGIGGLDLGFERAGLRCKWQVEINPYAQKVLAKHWPEVRRHDDVRTWPQPDTEYVDIIAGGFPCQDISFAGKGAGLAGERSGLFYEAMRIVREVGPRFIVLENVSALLVRGLDQVLGTLASLGYDAEWECLPAGAFGAPHIRDRVFVLGWNTNRKHDGQIGSGSSQNAYTGRDCNGQDQSESIPNANRERLQKRQGKDASGARQDRRAKPSRSEWWITEPAVGRVADGVPHRVDRLRGLGNAIVPQVAEYIAHRIVAVSENVA